MINNLSMRIRRILLPLILFLLAFQFYPALADTATSIQLVLRWLPFAMFAVAIVLSMLYHKYTITHAAFIATALYASYLQFTNNTEVENPRALLFFIATFFPLALTLVKQIPDKPLWHPVTFSCLIALLIASQAPYINEVQHLISSLWLTLPDIFITTSLDSFFLPNTALAVYAICLVISVIQYLKTPSHYQGVIVIAIFASAFLWLKQDPLILLKAVPLLGATFFFGVSIALIATVSIESYAMAYRDELTTIAGRRALMNKFNHLGKDFVIAMVDVDHFKRFNDTYGHDVGDEVLKMVAQRLARAKYGKAYRYGGEEFTLVFNNRNLDQVIPILEDLRRAISNYSFTFRDNHQRPSNNKRGVQHRHQNANKRTVRVTISIGAAMPNFAIKDPMAVLKMADEALYHAKESGRNCLKT